MPITLNIDSDEKNIEPQHYAFLVSEAEFDEIFGRIRERKLPWWARPGAPPTRRNQPLGRRPRRLLSDPDGHLLEITTRPYGSGGLQAEHPNPLIARPLDE